MFCFTVDGLHTNHFLSHAISTKFLRIQENMLKTIISYLELDLNIAWEPRRLMNMTHGSNAMSIEKKLGGGGDQVHSLKFVCNNLFFRQEFQKFLLPSQMGNFHENMLASKTEAQKMHCFHKNGQLWETWKLKQI